MERRYLLFVASSALFMATVLLIDRGGLVSQLVLCAATVIFLWRFARASAVPRRQIVCAIAVASLGEVILSLVWGLYTYQHFLIPLYVPPGHGLVYTLAAATAQQPALRARATAIARGVALLGSLIAIVWLFALGDVWGFLWWLLALALIARSRNQLLLSACFVVTTGLEWTGTAIGNWQWAAEVPFVGLHSANPPAGVGILYILLDLIVVAISGRLNRRAPRTSVSCVTAAIPVEAPQ